MTLETLLEVLQKCPKLTVLGAFCSSFSEDVFRELMKPERPPFKLLDILCKCLDKYLTAISDEVWGELCQHQPSLSVDIEFDHTVLAWKILRNLKPNIPVSTLQLNPCNELTRQLAFVSDHYVKTLRKLVIQTTSSSGLNSALIDIGKNCLQLEEIHCYCVVSSDVFQAFLTRCSRFEEIHTKSW